jgi:hypothetical protein
MIKKNIQMNGSISKVFTPQELNNFTQQLQSLHSTFNQRVLAVEIVPRCQKIISYVETGSIKTLLIGRLSLNIQLQSISLIFRRNHYFVHIQQTPCYQACIGNEACQFHIKSLKNHNTKPNSTFFSLCFHVSLCK